jgi:hypothetical protein
MQAVAQHRIVQHIDGHRAGQLLQALPHSAFVVAVVSAGESIQAEQMASLDEAIPAFVDPHLVRLKHLGSWLAGHVTTSKLAERVFARIARRASNMSTPRATRATFRKRNHPTNPRFPSLPGPGRRGLCLPLYALEEKLSAEEPSTDVLPLDQWRARFHAFLAALPPTTATFVDDSRERIYEGRGE